MGWMDFSTNEGITMDYLCMVYLEESKMQALTKAEMKLVDRQSKAYDARLRRSGRFIAARALQPVTAAATVRVRGRKVVVTDGPFMETKEHLGGFILIKAKDQKEALKIAAKIPLARIGSIEVRPILDF